MPENNVINMATGEVVIHLCRFCGFEVIDGKCLNEVNHASHAELPPLGVCVSDTAGAAGKVGN